MLEQAPGAHPGRVAQLGHLVDHQQVEQPGILRQLGELLEQPLDDVDADNGDVEHAGVRLGQADAAMLRCAGQHLI